MFPTIKSLLVEDMKHPEVTVGYDKEEREAYLIMNASADECRELVQQQTEDTERYGFASAHEMLTKDLPILHKELARAIGGMKVFTSLDEFKAHVASEV